MQDKIIKVPNISCEHCVHTIKSEIGSLEGVISVAVDKESKEVNISWHDDMINWESIKNLFAEIDFPVAE
jgi:copper chaperone CopZ